MKNSIDKYLEGITNPHGIVVNIENDIVPYNQLEVYHKAHNANMFRPIDYFFLSMYSRNQEVARHACTVLHYIEKGTTLERAIERHSVSEDGVGCVEDGDEPHAE